MYKTITFATLLLFASLNSSAQSQWNQFRGPEGMGIATDKVEYPAEFNIDKMMIWKTDVNFGLSSPVIWDNLIILTGHRRDTFETMAYDRISGECIVSYFGSYGLVCYERTDTGYTSLSGW